MKLWEKTKKKAFCKWLWNWINYLYIYYIDRSNMTRMTEWACLHEYLVSMHIIDKIDKNPANTIYIYVTKYSVVSSILNSALDAANNFQFNTKSKNKKSSCMTHNSKNTNLMIIMGILGAKWNDANIHKLH